MAKRMRGLYKRGSVWWAAYKGLDERVVRVSAGTFDYDEAVDFLLKRKSDVKEGIEPEAKKIVNHTFSELAGEYIINRLIII